ncbi:hypothetical protein BC826DRAFT_916029 [Russula brevipes]|nr:hypothetical protein BC826DRAFT_916029 [Russula brevipes]
MVYIPFASLLSLQAAFQSFLHKQPASGPPSLTPVHFINPKPGGGSFFDKVDNGLGEPLNVIVSGFSSPWVLSDGGFVRYANAVGFGIECLDIHLGTPQAANLGDGNGWRNQTIELRNDYGNPDIGTCWESLVGGNHLRMWRQNGPTATTNALFLAVSEEENVFDGHTISPDGYNLGRDNFVKGAVGLKKYKGIKYNTVVQNVTGLVPSGSSGVNHDIPIDGTIALLIVTIVP